MSQSVADGLDADTGREWSDAELIPLINSTGMKTAISEVVHRHNRKADLARAFERSLLRRHALLDMPVYVLDDDNRVIDDKAYRDGQSHQRQIVLYRAGSGSSGWFAVLRRDASNWLFRLCSVIIRSTP
jgi:hypothetical protein